MPELTLARSLRSLSRLMLPCACLATALAFGCNANKGVPSPAPSVDSAQTTTQPTSETADAASDDSEPATAEAPKRKGTRVVGGLPPIRRADLISGLTVPGAQRFFLGGGQPSSFYCDVENQGDTEVLISSTRGLGATVIARLYPGDSASHRFQPTEAAIIANLSPLEPAKLRVRIWGDTNLEMRYEPDQP